MKLKTFPGTPAAGSAARYAHHLPSYVCVSVAKPDSEVRRLGHEDHAAICMLRNPAAA